jgi:molybdate transport system regulatory protein
VAKRIEVTDRDRPIAKLELVAADACMISRQRGRRTAGQDTNIVHEPSVRQTIPCSGWRKVNSCNVFARSTWNSMLSGNGEPHWRTTNRRCSRKYFGSRTEIGLIQAERSSRDRGRRLAGH